MLRRYINTAYYYYTSVICRILYENASCMGVHNFPIVFKLSKIRDPVPAKFKHVTNIKTCMLLCCD